MLIDEVLEYVGNNKPVKRILLSALDEKSIKKALDNLRDNREFQGLKRSALARQRADWLIGMNLSRAYTITAQRAGHRTTYAIGRVKTPTLSLVVRREREIANYKPVEHYGFKALFGHVLGQFTAIWKAKDTQKGLDPEGRLTDLSEAGVLKRKFQSAAEQAVITIYETKEKKTPQPLPFSLSALQVAAGKRFGYSPQLVLDTAQALYEKKLTTYPRSDCDYLPENQLSDCRNILNNLAKIDSLRNWLLNTNSSIKSRAWDDTKITAHHAIIPTEVECKLSNLSEEEKNIYYLISQSYIAQFYPVHVYDQTSVQLVYMGEDFKTSGKVVKENGWRAIYESDDVEKTDSDDSDAGILPAMKKGDNVVFTSLKSLKKITKPPDRFTESTLLQAMKDIHKYVKNDDLKKQLKNVSGIGTEATRAGIIKDLIDRQFLEVEKKKLKPTEAALIMIDSLPDEITYPDTTAIWEDQLKLMETDTSDEKLSSFLNDQKNFISSLCSVADNTTIKSVEGQICPKCEKGSLIKHIGKNGPFWGCTRYREGCKATYQDLNGKPDTVVHSCPVCKEGQLKLIKGTKGIFWACNRFPECKKTFEDDKGKPKTSSVSKRRKKYK